MTDTNSEGMYDFRSDEYRVALLRSLKVKWKKLKDERLREYQEHALEVLADAVHPSRPQILHLATGGGKTRTACAFVERWLDEQEEKVRVLWITKDWRLLRQAAVEFKSRRQGGFINRFHGDGKELHPLNEFSERGKPPEVVFTTIQTLERQLEEYMDQLQPSLVVWDECHWGEMAGAAKILTHCKKNGIALLGLTATPRAATKSRWKVAYSKSFKELVSAKVLAKPIQVEVDTEVAWEPSLNSMRDADRASLGLLARAAKWNRKIVETYVEGDYGKTVVFACDVDHANKLAKAFEKAGVRAAAVHSRMEFAQEAFENVQSFKDGDLDVLVNVEMLTHGVDIPDISSVFLARPTTSDILFAQMVGRAARRAPGKTKFHVVDFTLNITKHGDLFERPKREFWGAVRE